MKELICVVCPKGCRLTVHTAQQTVAGNYCPRGAVYGLAEVNHPTRTLTTTVAITGAVHARLPVKTSTPIPKDKIMEAMFCVDRLRITAPVKIGEIILGNIADTGVDLVACRNMELER